MSPRPIDHAFQRLITLREVDRRDVAELAKWHAAEIAALRERLAQAEDPS